VRFTHVEDVRGALFPLFRAVMGSATQRSHDAVNAALKRRAEELAADTAMIFGSPGSHSRGDHGTSRGG
jgi:hypothetical protein